MRVVPRAQDVLAWGEPVPPMCGRSGLIAKIAIDQAAPRT